MKSILYHLIKFILLIVLPFLVLIRGSVFFHETYEVFPWLALLGGVVISAVVLVIYYIFIHGNLTGQWVSFKTLKNSYWVALILVAVYCIPGLLFLSAANAKHESVKEEFTSLHPVLRLGISTILFLDRDLIITDAKRHPEDYKKMGLPTKSHSLHYKQKNGYAHAIDIRVNGRSELRNSLLEYYFKIMGFNTLRHVGTDDHLHISILSHDRPRAI